MKILVIFLMMQKIQIIPHLHWKTENKKKEKKESRPSVEQVKEEIKPPQTASISVKTYVIKRKKKIQSGKIIIPFNHRGKLKLLTEKDIFDYFRFDIACNGGLSILNSKLGIFIDENFTKVTFIEVPMNSKALIFSYDIKPHPKLYPSTLHKVEK